MKKSNFLYQPIPEIDIPRGYKEIPIFECYEPLIEITSNDKILVNSIYKTLNYKYANHRIYLRLTVFNKLLEASKFLPFNYKFMLLDGHRTFNLQEEIYSRAKESLQIENPDWELDKVENIITQYVSEPSNNPTTPSPHLTGGSIDITLCNLQNETLNLGTEFDSINIKSETAYFENNKLANNEHENIANLRRILFNSLRKVGFTNYCKEWWHYDYGNQIWANLSSKKFAIYSSI